MNPWPLYMAGTPCSTGAQQFLITAVLEVSELVQELHGLIM